MFFDYVDALYGELMQVLSQCFKLVFLCSPIIILVGLIVMIYRLGKNGFQ